MSELAYSRTQPHEVIELLTSLCASMGIDASSTVISEAVERTPDLEEAGEAIGLRFRWMVGTLEMVGALVRPDLPVVAWPEQGGCWIIDGVLANRYRACAVAAPGGRKWWSRAQLDRQFGEGSIRWLLAEPVLPAAVLASPNGTRTPLRRLWALLWLERRDGVVVMVYGVATGLLALATPLAIQVLINWLAFGALIQPILLLGGMLLVCLGLAAGLLVLQRLAIEAIERRIFVRMVADLASRLSRVEVSAVRGLYGPELANRFFDVLTLQKATSSLLLDGFTALLQVAVAATLLGLYSPWLLVFDVFMLLGMFLVLVPLGHGAERTAILESKAKYAVAAWIEEIARHPIALRMNNAEIAEGKADRLARTWLEYRARHFRIVLRQFVGVQALQVTMSASLLVACGILVLRGQLTIGQLVAAEFIVNAALLGFVKFANKLDTIYDLMAGVDKLGSLLDLPAEPPGGRGAPHDGPADVEVVGAALTYPGGGGLGQTHLRLPAGSRTVVLGPPGAGKSALAQLITGLLVPTEGVVRRDGVQVRSLRPSVRYGGVALIACGDLLHGTLRENVAMGNSMLDDGDVWRALESVGLRSRVEQLGLNAVVDPTGVPLSTVDQRSLLVARAIVSRPRLIVVDGVLDGLPIEACGVLRDALLDPKAPWTVLILASDERVPVFGLRTFSLRGVSG